MTSEITLERSRSSGLEMQIEAQRKKLDELGDALGRKREKKRRWKELQIEAQVELGGAGREGQGKERHCWWPRTRRTKSAA